MPPGGQMQGTRPGGMERPEGAGENPGGGTPPQGTDTAPQGTDTAPQGTDTAPQGTDTAPQGTDAAPQGTDTTQESAGATQDATQQGDMPQRPAGEQNAPEKGDMGGMGTSDVKLQYIDDDADSYANIFGNAKTDITQADQARLIAALKALSQGENLEQVLDMDQVLRYFVVHNYVVNDDSYTGSMIHNYYLYEKDGMLSMIPWDYNLAFGGFQGGTASSAVNDPIDDVLEDRPMQSWIFSSEAYTQLYHQYYQQFLDTVDPQAIIQEAYALITPYVERDPTKFCTTEEFHTGVSTLLEFCALRSESVEGQLAGTIPSTTQAQQEDSEALVASAAITLSDMGSMNQNGGGMGMTRPSFQPEESGTDGAVQPEGGAQLPAGQFSEGTPPAGAAGDGQGVPAPEGVSSENGGEDSSGTGTDAAPSQETDAGETTPEQPDAQGGSLPGGEGRFPNGGDMTGGGFPGAGGAQQGSLPGGVSQTAADPAALATAGACLVLLAAGMVFAWRYTRRSG